jgi:peptidoglycan/LPS O-acetylase OafA/YrhL
MPPLASDAPDSLYLEQLSPGSSQDNGSDDFPFVPLKYRSAKSLSLRFFLNRFKSLLFFLCPSFLQSYFGGVSTHHVPLGPTACLDGLRGLGALTVFIFHFTFAFNDVVQYGWGLDSNNMWFHQLPFIKLLYAGDFQVVIFFVISGYVLSMKPLRLIRSRSTSLLSALSSSTFRRAFRLYLPTTTVMALTALGLHFGMNETSHFYLDHKLITGHMDVAKKTYPTFLGSLGALFGSLNHMFRIWDWNPHYPYYDHHLWTIPLEFRGSLVVFLTLLAFAQTTTFVRMTGIGLLALNAAWWDRWDMMLFLGGIFIAESDLIASDHGLRSPILPSRTTSPSDPEKPHSAAPARDLRTTIRTAWPVALFVAGLYMGSWPPRRAHETPGYATLNALIPFWFRSRDRFWPCMGGLLVVKAVTNGPVVQRLYNTPFAQYFGRISFTLYLIHGPMDHALGYSLLGWIWGRFADWTEWPRGTEELGMGPYMTGWFVGAVIHMCVVICVADVFTRAVDVRSVRFARWVEAKCCVGK